MNSSPVIICIGSERISGDSLGPLVGDLLTEKYNVKCFVYGTSKNSVNGQNLEVFLGFIKAAHGDSKIIAVDAALGKKSSLDKIKIKRDGVCPKRAVTGQKNSVGDVGVLGVTGEASQNPLTALLSAAAKDVQNLALKVAFVINFALNSTKNI